MSGTSQLRRYPVDDIMEPTEAMLQVPWGRMGKKKNVAHGVVQPPNPEARYHDKPIPPEYGVVEVAWTHDHHDDGELDFPNEEGDDSRPGSRHARAVEQGRYCLGNDEAGVTALTAIVVSLGWPK